MMRRAPSVAPQLPGYEFVSILGSGGFSDVFLYQQRLPRRRVAVKEIGRASCRERVSRLV